MKPSKGFVTVECSGREVAEKINSPSASETIITTAQYSSPEMQVDPRKVNVRGCSQVVEEVCNDGAIRANRFGSRKLERGRGYSSSH